ncbi:MAG: aldose epimerase family protein [Christensenellales bacterium]
MKVTASPFGSYHDGTKANLITIDSAYGSVSFTDFAASIVSVAVPDKDGNMGDVVLGLDDGPAYQQHGGSLGAICGRFANRLVGSVVKLGGVEYGLDKNHDLFTLHGGSDGFSKRIWDFVTDDKGVTFSLRSPDGDQGFPGNMDVSVRYEFSDDGVLSIDYWAKSDKDTPANFTNHAYFNLSGHDSGDAHQLLQINGGFFNPQLRGQLPSGEVRFVEGTVMDFRTERDAAEASMSDDELIVVAGGLDHNFLLNKSERGALEYAGSLRSASAGRKMEVYTTMPAMMIYAANSMHMEGKGGAQYRPWGAICMECQNVPDSMRHTHFPSPVLKAGEEYTARTEYRFLADK